jgi:hypothetical protein
VQDLPVERRLGALRPLRQATKARRPVASYTPTLPSYHRLPRLTTAYHRLPRLTTSYHLPTLAPSQLGAADARRCGGRLLCGPLPLQVLQQLLTLTPAPAPTPTPTNPNPDPNPNPNQVLLQLCRQVHAQAHGRGHGRGARFPRHHAVVGGATRAARRAHLTCSPTCLACNPTCLACSPAALQPCSPALPVHSPQPTAHSPPLTAPL